MAIAEFELTGRKPGWLEFSELSTKNKLFVPCTDVDNTDAVETSILESNLSYRWYGDSLFAVPGVWTSGSRREHHERNHQG